MLFANKSDQAAPMQASAYTYARFAADLDALRQQLGQERVWLMGHSEAGRHAVYSSPLTWLSLQVKSA